MIITLATFFKNGFNSFQLTQLVIKLNDSIAINRTVERLQTCPFAATKAYFGQAPSTANNGRRKRQASASVDSLVSFEGVLQVFISYCV